MSKQHHVEDADGTGVGGEMETERFETVIIGGGHAGYLTHPTEFVELVRRICSLNERSQP